jgi:hypothetical protein
MPIIGGSFQTGPAPAGFALSLLGRGPATRTLRACDDSSAQTSASRPMLAVPVPVTMGQVEIRIELDRIEPPAGRLRVMPYPEWATGAERDGDAGTDYDSAGRDSAGRDSAGRDSAGRDDADRGQIRFAGWLGLLRALYEITEAAKTVPPPES